MLKIRSIAALFFVCALVTGCATVPEVAYDRAQNNIHKIAVLNIAFPEKATAPNVGASAGNTMASFGLIGALVGGSIEAASQDARQDRLKEAVAEETFDAYGTFKSELTAALEAEGYEVVFIEEGDKSRTDHMETLPASTMGADAVFDIVTTGYGYLSSGKMWRPYMQTKVLLRDSKTGNAIMQNQVFYNDFGAGGHSISIPPDPAYSWKKNDDVGRDAHMTVAGLEDAIAKSVDAIATLLN